MFLDNKHTTFTSMVMFLLKKLSLYNYHTVNFSYPPTTIMSYIHLYIINCIWFYVTDWDWIECLLMHPPLLLCPLLSSSVSGKSSSLPSPARKPTLKIGISFPLLLRFSYPVFLALFPICSLSNLWDWNITDVECPHNVLRKISYCSESFWWHNLSAFLQE